MSHRLHRLHSTVSEDLGPQQRNWLTPLTNISLAEIIHFEATFEFLPVDIAVIVKKLIKMRIDIVQNAPQRVESDYVLWPDRGQEHATQFYPQREIWRYPKKYLMQNQGIDQDLCQKSFNSSRTFTNGVFR